MSSQFCGEEQAARTCPNSAQTTFRQLAPALRGSRICSGATTLNFHLPLNACEVHAQYWQPQQPQPLEHASASQRCNDMVVRLSRRAYKCVEIRGKFAHESQPLEPASASKRECGRDTVASSVQVYSVIHRTRTHTLMINGLWRVRLRASATLNVVVS